MAMDHIKLTPEVLSVDEVTHLVTDPSCGAVSLFVGTTRDHFQGQTVVRLEYEAYQEMAEKEMLKLCQRAREKWTLKHIAMFHRLGVVPVTESSVILAVSSEHRRESLEAVSFLIDELKANVPIWKKEIYDDGSGDWKKNKECQWANGKDPEVETKMNGEETRSGKRALDDSDKTAYSQTLKKVKIEHPEEAKSTEHCKRDEDPSCDTKKGVCEPDNYENKGKIDPAYVQIVVSKKELDRRIAAFQQRKRQELDVLNVQEFCTLSGGASTMSSCARTSAIVHRSKDSNSHLKLTKVVNEWGPQTRGIDPGSKPIDAASKEEEKEMIRFHRNSSDSLQEPSLNIKKENSSESIQCKTESIGRQGMLPEGIEERLHNVESHLRILPGGPVPQDVYARLKAVEDRLLHLEGISPEYFGDKKIKIPEKQSNKKEFKAVEDDISLNEIDLRIHQLKMKLKQRQIRQVI
ncbi:molybdopterin synthase catalytic subunit-like isoform X2 [Penaeus japonicus]|uniref:molybdopterin synthase catalytic subunit-like isoform X2 n=1 Tax=Penaeus japonicus TaxID=27405 RepID=UPI001C713E18|nr:molybdopterin synthase catalytic subunit-like isoform X2 [Penaeus japonicus]